MKGSIIVKLAGSYNGSTADSESAYHGSNPCPAAKFVVA